MSLTVLIRDRNRVHRLYKLHETEVPIHFSEPSVLVDFIRTLLILRNMLIVNVSLLYTARRHRSGAMKTVPLCR